MGAGPEDLQALGSPMLPIANLPDVISRNSVSSRQFSSGGRGRSDLRNLILGEFRSTATMQVLSMSYGFQVFRMNARAIVAKVIYLQSFWNWTKGAFVGHAMRSTVLPESAISLSVYVSVPDKTHRGESTITLVPQIFTPDRTWLQARRMSVTETSGMALEKICELSTSAFAEMPTRLKTHVGLLLRLTLGGGVLALLRSPHLIGSQP